LCFCENGKYFFQGDRGKGSGKAGATEWGATKPGRVLGGGYRMEAPLGGAGVTGAFARGWGWCLRRGRLQMCGYGVGMVVDAMMGAELSCRSLCWNL
jgi:hypothetical protein